MSDACIHCFVAGRVQGVWFRASTQRKAEELGLTGWVKNTDDGRVEVKACGAEEKLHALQEWLQYGPPTAEVSSLDVERDSFEVLTGFVVLH